MSGPIGLHDDSSLRYFLTRVDISNTTVIQGLLSSDPLGWAHDFTDVEDVGVHFVSCGGRVQVQVHLRRSYAAGYNGHYLSLVDSANRTVTEARFIDGLAVLSLDFAVLDSLRGGHLDMSAYSSAELELMSADVKKRRDDEIMYISENREDVAARVLPPATQALRPRYLPQPAPAGRVASEPLYTDTFP